MFCSGRLLSRVSPLNLSRVLSGVKCVKANVIPTMRLMMPKANQSTVAANVAKENFFVKQTRLNRPLSPHLTIYSPQLTSVLSVCHRITGAGFAVALSGGSILLAASGAQWVDVINGLQSLNLSPEIVTSAKFFFAFPFTYHCCNGVRHL
eukprot:Ihof_evm1s650 gene=Ihof_evmTU1s650